ncbi:hypothetical protein D3C78_1174930 [compost metagenome]
MAGARAAAPHRNQIRQVLGEHQAGVPVARVAGRVVRHRQPAQVAVAGGDLVAFTYWLQPRTQQRAGQADRALVQLLFIVTAHVERQGATVQLVLAADDRASLFDILAGLGRGQVFTDGFARQAVQLILKYILRFDHQGQTHHHPFG